MQPTTARDFDFEKTEPSYWRLQAWWMVPLAVFAVTVALTVFMFPPFRAEAFAYVFAAPFVLWALFKPRFKVFALTVFAAQAVAWTILLAWLHHVTWPGLFLLGPFVGAWVGVWYLAMWWVAGRVVERPFAVRAAAMLGLAGLWVFIEWTRTWLLGGFPWLPLGASQWRLPAVIQIASYTGQGGIAFVLITFNYAFGSYMHRLFAGKHTGLRRRSPEFSIALLMLVLAVAPFLGELFSQRREAFARVALVQTNIPQSVKWTDHEQSFHTLGELTAAAKTLSPDLIVWPEAAVTVPITGVPDSAVVQEWMQLLSRKWFDDSGQYPGKFEQALGALRAAKKEMPVPLLVSGIMCADPSKPYDTMQNAAAVIDPATGLQPKHYVKRHLVPFGEYVPLRSLFGWLEKITDAPGGDMLAGASSAPLYVRTRNGLFAAGMLICYEDIFPNLAVLNVLGGADAHVVITNNAWYGQGGAAYQHAAHSVLRAVETRRPVIRCSNGGWSGWIDEFGNVRSVMLNSKGTIYHDGVGMMEITRDQQWVGRDSFYVRHGDWFILLCAVLAVFGAALLRFYKPHDATQLEEKPGEA